MSDKKAKLAAKIARLQRQLKRMSRSPLHKGEAKKIKRRKHDNKVKDSKERQQAAMWLNKARNLWQPKLCTMPYPEYLQTEYWNAIRQHLFALRGRKCQKCGIRDCELHVHHTSYAYKGQEHLGLKFLQILCAPHHREIHGIKDI